MELNTAVQTVEEPATQTKRCSRCSEKKLLGEFYKNNGHTEKRYSRCKACTLAGAKERAEGMKRCSVCRQVKPREDFWRSDRMGRLLSVCKVCMDAARSEIAETKECARCGKRRHVFDFYADASRPDGRKRCCKECWDVAKGVYSTDTVGDHVEAQIESILRIMAESQYRLDEAELWAGELRAKQLLFQEELTRICAILRTDADPVNRRCDFGRIIYDDSGLSMTLEPELAWLRRDQN